jgi:hypothetical protein
MNNLILNIYKTIIDEEKTPQIAQIMKNIGNKLY